MYCLVWGWWLFSTLTPHCLSHFNCFREPTPDVLLKHSWVWWGGLSSVECLIRPQHCSQHCSLLQRSRTRWGTWLPCQPKTATRPSVNCKWASVKRDTYGRLTANRPLTYRFSAGQRFMCFIFITVSQQLNPTVEETTSRTQHVWRNGIGWRVIKIVSQCASWKGVVTSFTIREKHLKFQSKESIMSTLSYLISQRYYLAQMANEEFGSGDKYSQWLQQMLKQNRVALSSFHKGHLVSDLDCQMVLSCSWIMCCRGALLKCHQLEVKLKITKKISTVLIRVKRDKTVKSLEFNFSVFCSTWVIWQFNCRWLIILDKRINKCFNAIMFL